MPRTTFRPPERTAAEQREVETTFSACGHTARFRAGTSSTSPSRCPQGCEPLRPQHRRGR